MKTAVTKAWESNSNDINIKTLRPKLKVLVIRSTEFNISKHQTGPLFLYKRITTFTNIFCLLLAGSLLITAKIKNKKINS